MKFNLVLKLTYNNYLNRLYKVIRLAKQQYNESILIRYKINSARLWNHLNSIIKPKENCSILINPNLLNDYFVSVFKQAPLGLSKKNLFIIPRNKLYIADFLFLSPTAYN